LVFQKALVMESEWAQRLASLLVLVWGQLLAFLLVIPLVTQKVPVMES
jgi:hypothetical protein